MGASDLRVTVDAAKLRCVLDPALALAHAHGPRLALGLTRVFETWLTRSFWQVLDASELLLLRGTAGGAAAAPDPAALTEWIALREGTDAGSWLLRWVGDCLAESQLRSAGDEPVVERFEWLAEALQRRDEAAGRREGWCHGLDARAAALDGLALSAALDGALLLCPWPAGTEAPVPVQALARAGVPAEAATANEDLFAAERQWVRQQLAAAGLVPMLSSVGRLCAVHALAPPGGCGAAGDAEDPWAAAAAWWYAL